jgi:hypothetical protein
MRCHAHENAQLQPSPSKGSCRATQPAEQIIPKWTCHESGQTLLQLGTADSVEGGNRVVVIQSARDAA